MIIHRYRDWQRADRTEVFLRPLQPLTVQLLVPELSRTLLARLLVLLAVGPLAVHAAILDEAAGSAVLELAMSLPRLPQLAQASTGTSLMLRRTEEIEFTDNGVPSVQNSQPLPKDKQDCMGSGGIVSLQSPQCNPVPAHPSPTHSPHVYLGL